MKNEKRKYDASVDIVFGLLLASLAVLILIVLALVFRSVIHSAILPDENQAQCESLGGKWSVNSQCYNAGEPTTIKKLKDNLKAVK